MGTLGPGRARGMQVVGSRAGEAGQWREVRGPQKALGWEGAVDEGRATKPWRLKTPA